MRGVWLCDLVTGTRRSFICGSESQDIRSQALLFLRVKNSTIESPHEHSVIFQADDKSAAPSNINVNLCSHKN